MSLIPTRASGSEGLSAAAFGSAGSALPSIRASGSQGLLASAFGPALHALPSLSSTSLADTAEATAFSKPGVVSRSLTLGLNSVGPDDALSHLQVCIM